MIFFKEQPTTRQKQVEVLRNKLGIKFDLINKGQEDYEHYDRVRQNFIAMKLSKFIRSEDNSLRGFRLIAKATFTNVEKPTKYAIHYKLFKNKMNRNIVDCFYTKEEMDEVIKEKRQFGYKVTIIEHSEKSFAQHLK